jgi:hypothetical protein
MNLLIWKAFPSLEDALQQLPLPEAGADVRKCILVHFTQIFRDYILRFLHYNSCITVPPLMVQCYLEAITMQG